MDPTVAAQMAAAWGFNVKAQADDYQAALARARDHAEFDGRMLQGFVTGQLYLSDISDSAVASNLAARTPTTLEHPPYGQWVPTAPAPTTTSRAPSPG